ncbi:glycosyltransferase family 2 protein [Pseudoduganella aquatica]|uniref:Glycosyltransferase n=1 Tax=Pseudoduganella aquatica TaxID=2660641 RepID=A0A7X4KQR9_9BURK|nr:glycosyltransferase family A protein [Pseudoduganella aquatica]MYN11215.1 glycosyltransferase [Pseudoduganella aquatica]
MNKTVAVVIPYYQKRPGILAKAIRSALAQEGGVALDIIVIDDSSPVPARGELAGIDIPAPHALRIVEQPNAGPAAARNRALGLVAPGTEYVAFLDSDDEWIPAHVANAVAALEAGHDFYFSDHYQLNQTVTAFKRARRIEVGDHPAIGASPYLHSYRGDMFNQILTGNIVGTSTVVYRHAAGPELRFREEFVYAGEDYLFWLELAQRSGRVAFSALCECTYGEGVNIFAGSGWGTENSLIRLHYEMKFKKALPRLFSLSPAQLRQNGADVRGLRRSFVADLLHRLSHRKRLDGAVLRGQWRIDPQSFLYAPLLAVGVLLKR